MPGDTVFVCTAEECDAGPWEGSHDAMAHCAENPGHAYTGRPRNEVETDPLPATSVEDQDNRNLQHKGDPQGAVADQE
ncbi:MAG: hypothetical protein ABEH81_09300 [Halopenitus sp.]|uniref:hypothetical protein n=1 Tax=Haloparvum sp. PAK95 TaxID=3418962 RepID=UPI0035EE6840